MFTSEFRAKKIEYWSVSLKYIMQKEFQGKKDVTHPNSNEIWMMNHKPIYIK